MMNRTPNQALSVLVLFAAPGLAFGAEAPADWCGAYDPDHPLAWNRFERQVEQHMATGESEEAHRLITDEFMKQVGTPFGDQEEVRLVVIATSTYMIALRDEGVSPEVWRQDLRDEPDRLQYELVTGEFLELPCEAFDDVTSPLPSIAYYAYAMYQAGHDGRLDLARSAAAAVASTTYQTYRELISNGLPMWPWELLISGSGVSSDFTQPAPTTQLIVFRPNAGPVLRFDGTEDSQMDVGLTVEPIGFVRYRKDDYSKWWGMSALFGLTNDNGIGYGALVRYDNYVLGAAYHDNSDDIMLYLNIDLYKYVLGEDGRTTQANEFSKALIDKFTAVEQGAN